MQIYNRESMRRFAQVELGDDVAPDETRFWLSPFARAARAHYAEQSTRPGRQKEENMANV